MVFTSFLMAGFVAILGIIPLLLIRRFVVAVITAACFFVPSWLIFYASTPSLVYPLGGAIGGLLFVAWFFSALIASVIEDGEGNEVSAYPWVLPAGAFVIYLIIFIFGSNMFNASRYAGLIGEYQKSEWTQDIQPADPTKVRLVPEELAYYLADKQLAQAPGAIGSQFQLATDYAVLQRINQTLWWVIPLDYKGWRVWTTEDFAPGYIMVHGDDPFITPIVKYNEKLRYTPGAYFRNNLERHLRSHGYLFKGLTDYSLEIDEEGKAWWVVSVFEPTITYFGNKILGVAIVDPETGDSEFKSMGDIPSWVDRAVPGHLVTYYLEKNGSLHGGWWNSVWAHKNITQPEEPEIVYGADGEPYWVTGITSSNVNDNSLIGLMYTNSRTGQSVFYHTVGATDEAVLAIVDNQVSYRKWHGASPTVYNLYGYMTSVVPLLGEHHTFQGVALVRIDDQQAVHAENLQDALREYQKILGGTGNLIAPETGHNLTQIDGVVDRTGFEIKGNYTVFYLHLSGIPSFFIGGTSELSAPELALTKPGDQVKIHYLDSGEDVLPMKKFENHSLPLSTTDRQQQVRDRGRARAEEQETHKDAQDARSSLGKMSDRELQELIRQYKENGNKL